MGEGVLRALEMICGEENITPDAALLKLLANYGMSPVAFSTLLTKLKESFSKVSFTELKTPLQPPHS